jgi:hypothetical protein
MRGAGGGRELDGARTRAVPVLPAGAVVSGPAPILDHARAVSVSTENASPSTVAGPGEVRVAVEQLDALSLLQSVITLANEAPGISHEQLRDRLIALTDWSR